MAKVMISMPDELLADLDREAQAHGSTRSGLLQQLAAEHLERRRADRAARIARLLAAARPHDGRAVEHLRADRSR